MGFFEKMGFGPKKEEAVVKTETPLTQEEIEKATTENIQKMVTEIKNQGGVEENEGNGEKSKQELYREKAQEILNAFKEYKKNFSEEQKAEVAYKQIYTHVKRIVDAASQGKIIKDLNLELQEIYRKDSGFPKVEPGEFVVENAPTTGGVTAGSSHMKAA